MRMSAEVVWRIPTLPVNGVPTRWMSVRSAAVAGSPAVATNRARAVTDNVAGTRMRSTDGIGAPRLRTLPWGGNPGSGKEAAERRELHNVLTAGQAVSALTVTHPAVFGWVHLCSQGASGKRSMAPYIREDAGTGAPGGW